MIYEFECEDCGVVGEFVAEVKDYNNPPPCTCGGKTKRVIITAPKGWMAGNFEPFQSTVDRSIIRGQKDLVEHNKRNNVVSLADGYTTEQLMNHKGVPEQKPSDVKAEVAEAYTALKNGYKPQLRGAYDGN